MESPLELASKQLAREIDTRSSVDLQLKITIKSFTADLGNAKSFDSQDEHFIEMAGKRFDDVHSYSSGKLVDHSAKYGDGSKGAFLAFDPKDPERQTQAVVNPYYGRENRSDQMDRPDPIQLLFVGRQPLNKALANAKYLGTDKFLGRECHLFLFEKVRWNSLQDHVYYLDRATSIPLRVESFSDQAAREKQEPLWVWSAESLDQVENHYVPMKSTLTAFNNGGPRFSWTYRVQSVSFNKDYPASTFWPRFQPGVRLFDAISKKRTLVPGLAPQESSAKEMVSASPPIQALPSGDWKESIPGITLGLGLLLLLAGVLLSWRRRWGKKRANS